MKIVQVTYTARKEFAEQNKLNIQAVMDDMMKANHEGIFYNACVAADGKTFIHTAFYQSEDDQKWLTALDSFKKFQQELKASAPEAAPRQELLTLVGASEKIFS